jgi:hypothetical protein
MSVTVILPGVVADTAVGAVAAEVGWAVGAEVGWAVGTKGGVVDVAAACTALVGACAGVAVDCA